MDMHVLQDQQVPDVALQLTTCLHLLYWVKLNEPLLNRSSRNLKLDAVLKLFMVQIGRIFLSKWLQMKYLLLKIVSHVHVYIFIE